MIDPKLLADHASAKQVAVLLDNKCTNLEKRLEELVGQLADLNGHKAPEQLLLELTRLQEQSARFQKKLFGDSSERRPKDRDKTGDKTKARGHGATPQPELPHVDTTIELDEDERVCPSCSEIMQPMAGATEDSELIDVLRQQFLIRNIRRQKYSCKCGIGVKVAPPPVKHLARGRYSLDFAAHTAAEKHVNHQPLDRQRRAMGRLGLRVTTQTLWDQIEALAKILEPVYDTLREYILGGDVMGVDETWWRLLKKKPTKRWWVWCMATPNAVWYGIDDSRSAKTAAKFIGDFEGIIVCDAYKAYETVAKASSNLRLALCWSHARRYFIDAEPHYPQCAEAISLIGELFEIDRQTEDPTLLVGEHKIAAAEERQRMRAERAPPILEKLRAWAIEQRGLPKSSLRKAIDYMLGHWNGLTTFLDDPFVPLHNNATERALRGVVLGRKNHLGSKSRRGTEVAAIYYSLLETAMLCGLDPHAYLTGAVYGLEHGMSPVEALPMAPNWQRYALPPPSRVE